MRLHLLRWLGLRPSRGGIAFLALATVLSVGCGRPSEASHDDAGAAASSLNVRYLTDASARRAALVRSLVNPSNGYSQLRLAHYDTGDARDWSRLPESNPRVEAVLPTELDEPGGAIVGTSLGANADALMVSDQALGGDTGALLALGEKAFFEYPVQVSLAAEKATVSRVTFTDYGFWIDDVRGAGGLVRAEASDGTPLFAFTCATCHAATRSGALVTGVGNDRLDLGRLTVDAALNPDPTVVTNLLAWGPGRLDVTTETGLEPVRFGDTRPIQWLDFLQADGTVAVADVTALAIRIETLIITSHGAQDRPPRAVALGLALYLESLGAGLPRSAPAGASELRGAGVFESNCVSCHVPPSLTGDPVPLAVAGTNPTDGLSQSRGTGSYRVPSLHGVGTRGPLLHDASLPSLNAMFDPSRLQSTYSGGRLGPGPVAGHVFGLALNAGDRADLVSYLDAL
jgi:mono/diheme cytochrome c family protein